MKTNKRILSGLLAALQVVTPTLSWAQSAPTTYITYDEVGQTKQVTSPAGRTRQLQWDAVGRLTSETRGGATVGYGYNGQDTLTSVTDPRNLGTTYDRNGFGEARSQNSPDTAASTFSYDLNGNLTSRVNAAGQTESYAYDAANRVTSKTISHPTQGSRTYTFAYGANATAEAGNLTQVSATGMTLGFTHNLFGQTTQVSQSLTGSVPLTTGYAYAANGTPTSITYPSGRVVTYTLDSASRVTALTSAGTPLLSGITYSPLGALAGWTFGSGQAVTRTYDLNGRITGITMPAGTRSYSYDADDRIVGINDPVLGSATYDYDDLDRLTSASTSLGSWTYQYDATGNRISSGGGASNTTVSIDNASNRVLSTSGAPSRLYSYTNDGHASLVDGAAAQPTCGSSVTMGFQADGQMVSSNVLSAVHSPSGLRLQKTAAACAGGTTTNFVYDLAGHLIGEYDGSGAVVQETVWLGDVPVAAFKPSVALTPFYVYADNLGSPRAITNASAQLVWQWDGEPFGATAANSNPSGLGEFGNNLRFPGQYLDVETGYHHNGWREYDPAVGRYVQSDPIGLRGGLNTYAYADGNPLNVRDPDGTTGETLLASCGAGGVYNPVCDIGLVMVGITVAHAAYQMRGWAIPAGQAGARVATSTATNASNPRCNGVPPVSLDSSKYPETARHIQDAIAAGHPAIVTLDRENAAAKKRRSESMAFSGMPTYRGLDRDEWPMAMFAEGGAGSSVRYINSKDNRGAGSVIGAQCAPVANGCPVQIQIK